MGKTGYFTHRDCWKHDMGRGHPECPERLGAIEDRLLLTGVGDALEHRDVPLATLAQITRAHSEAHLEYLEELHQRLVADEPAGGPAHAMLDPDTILNRYTLLAARRAAGAAIAATDAVMAGEVDNAFCSVRPPGHHARPIEPMGFCLFNNVAVAAKHALDARGLARVAIVDFDVHHGNGTQAAFEADPSVFFASIHQSPLYPGTGDPSETGVGNVANATVAPHAPREVWRRGFEGLMDQVDGFAPDLILVSAGFDAHVRDPLAQQSLEAADFAWATRAIASVANRRCGGRIVSSLEGGYDLEALGRSAAAHVKALQEG